MTSNYRKVKSAQSSITNLLRKTNIHQGNSEEHASFLQDLLGDNSELYSEKQINEHILTFLNAGLDTTAAHINYAILFLSMHPECQGKLVKEIEGSSSSLDIESITKLDYLDRVVKESLRLAPPIFLIGRETIEDFEISPGCVIPKQTSLAVNVFVLHRRKDLYGDTCDTFDPDNFLPEKVSQRHPQSFLPFSAGRRNCIGYRFAINFIKIVLISLLKNFQFTTDSKMEDLQFKYGMTLKLTEDHLVSIRKRKNKI